jgi:hypothetical protein
MFTVKDLFENEELMNTIVEDIEDLPEDTEVFYAIWALGYDANNEPTKDEVLVGEFTNPDDAVEYAKALTIKTVNEMGFGEPDPNTTYFSIDVETVVGDPDDEDGGTMNIGTIFKKELRLEPKVTSVVISSTDYSILEDGALRVNGALLQGYKPNDIVKFYFIEELGSDVLTYKIMSETVVKGIMYVDCELLI